jgi:hypothetical protein
MNAVFGELRFSPSTKIKDPFQTLILSKEGETVDACASWSSGPGAALPLDYFPDTGLRRCAGLFSPALCGCAGRGHDA